MTSVFLSFIFKVVGFLGSRAEPKNALGSRESMRGYSLYFCKSGFSSTIFAAYSLRRDLCLFSYVKGLSYSSDSFSSSRVYL